LYNTKYKDIKPKSFYYLFERLFPAVRLIAEGTLELLGHSSPAHGSRNHRRRRSGAAAAAPAVHIPLAHQLLQMLFEARLVGELPAAVGATQRTLHPVVRGLQVIIQEALLSEVFVAVVADKGTLPGVHAVVDVQVGLACVRLLADGASEGFLACAQHSAIRN
jgi:hypothetical protein